ncbi:hypothetical protein Ae201684P_015993 [Aphanomyces euteiches]|nr:hypothetical protein Ae201684P_015993 [Aphanomyces euteiches]
MTEEGKAARSKGRPKIKTSGPSAIWCEESVRELFRLKYSEPLIVLRVSMHDIAMQTVVPTAATTEAMLNAMSLASTMASLVWDHGHQA